MVIRILAHGDSWRRLRGQIEMMIIAARLRVGGSRMKYDEHLVIVEVVASGDVNETVRVLEAHMSHPGSASSAKVAAISDYEGNQ